MKRHLPTLFAAVCLSTVAYSFSAESGAETSFVAPADKALLVFVRTSKLYKRRDVKIVDDKLRAYASFEARQHAVALVEPGEHSFYTIGQNTERFDLEVAAGRTYVVLVRVNTGMGNVRAVPDPVKRSDQDFDESVKWIRETKPSPSAAGLEESAKKKEGDLAERISDANENWKSRNDEWRATHSVSVEDGRTAAEAGKI